MSIKSFNFLISAKKEISHILVIEEEECEDSHNLLTRVKIFFLFKRRILEKIIRDLGLRFGH